MKTNCSHLNCILPSDLSPTKRLIVRNGRFKRKSDSRLITRYFCRGCKTYFSASTSLPSYCQKKRRITYPLKILLNSGVSQRRAAMILKTSRKTISRRFRFIANQERITHEKWLKSSFKSETQKLKYIQFDDLETAEHTKCKPLSVALAVDPGTRRILGFQVSKMPAKGLLSKTSLRKYGYRKDERSKGWDALMKSLIPIITFDAEVRSDENPHYPKYIRRHHPNVKHIRVKGGRGAITGQGELKKLRYDPIFSLNHTCAMLRANLNRLFRRTWCISKNVQGLIDHLSIYVTYHNLVLTVNSRKASAVLEAS